MTKRTYEAQRAWEQEQIAKYIATGKMTVIPEPKSTIKEDGQTENITYGMGD